MSESQFSLFGMLGMTAFAACAVGLFQTFTGNFDFWIWCIGCAVTGIVVALAIGHFRGGSSSQKFANSMLFFFCWCTFFVMFAVIASGIESMFFARRQKDWFMFAMGIIFAVPFLLATLIYMVSSWAQTSEGSSRDSDHAWIDDESERGFYS